VLSDYNILWDEEDCDDYDDNNNHNKPDGHSGCRKISMPIPFGRVKNSLFS
jgi:hypothetical protein